MTTRDSETSPTAIRVLLFGGPAFYFLVTLGVGGWVFLEDPVMLGVPFVVALVGAIVGFAVLRRSYRAAGYL